jgi:hypothetical protein
LTAEKVMYEVCAPTDELAAKVIYLESKRMALEDMLAILKSNDDMSISDKLKLIRRLSNK